MVRLIVCGACGRMGSRILELASADGNFRIAGAVESKGHPSLGKKILDGSLTVTDDLESLKVSSGVIIDFTTPKATLSHLYAIRSWKGVSCVIGTTGFSKPELSLIGKESRKRPLLLSPNMSLGVNLMMDLVRSCAGKVPNYDIEIIEAHHNLKKDSPSGTALALAREIAGELHRNFDEVVVHGRKGILGPRDPREIGIHSLRGGDIAGDHTVLFAGAGERLEITHRASGRDAFALGALKAARWIVGKKPGLYSMKDVLS